jgi:hypothetical protein
LGTPGGGSGGPFLPQSATVNASTIKATALHARRAVRLMATYRP